jgi:hypothetical protein
MRAWPECAGYPGWVFLSAIRGDCIGAASGAVTKSAAFGGLLVVQLHESSTPDCHARGTPSDTGGLHPCLGVGEGADRSKQAAIGSVRLREVYASHSHFLAASV